jgi:hypothetical protein
MYRRFTKFVQSRLSVLELTPLERGVLDWIARNSNDDRVREQLQHVKATSREFTGVGSFTDLCVPADAPCVDFRVSPVDPYIESPQLQHGGGSVLFFEDGHAATLELYAIADVLSEDITDWRLLPEKLPQIEGG